jgi:hypothetical protein
VATLPKNEDKEEVYLHSLRGEQIEFALVYRDGQDFFNIRTTSGLSVFVTSKDNGEGRLIISVFDQQVFEDQLKQPN